MRLTHALLPQLSSRGGQVVNVASVVGFVAAPNLAALAASKAALFAWSVALVTLSSSSRTTTGLANSPSTIILNSCPASEFHQCFSEPVNTETVSADFSA